MNQGGTADSIFALFVLDGKYISVKDVFVLFFGREAKEYFYLEVLIMKIFPDLSDVKKIAATGNYNVLPVSLEILSDFTTPIETMKILKNVSTHCYMLESAQANETWGRYTFLGFDPKLEITCSAGEIKIGKLKNSSG